MSSAPPDVPLTVVYVEDDLRLASLTCQYLQNHGITVEHVARGDEAVGVVRRVKPDVVLLDLMLPGMDGVEVCKKLREHMDVPIVMLTARTEEADRVLGLEGGADDYVTKPFSSRELVARIRAQARRARGTVGPRPDRIVCGSLIIDTATMTVLLRGEMLHLTTLEFALLRTLAERSGRVLSREHLLELIQGTATEAFDRSIDIHVSRLRAKLGDDPRHPQMLKTVRGVGYTLVADASC